MIKSENDLKDYIDNYLSNDFSKLITVKDSEKSKIHIFENRKSGKKIVQRFSANRNDDVFRALRTIKSNNFVNVLEVCSDDEYLIVIEEYVEGKNLLEMIKSGRIDKKTACKYTMQICDALTVLHSNGIVHRDIKPENIIVTDDNNAVLIDFSIARRAGSENDKDTDNLGTVGYAAPEQYGITQSNKTTDIYSLGVLLNIMLTGEHPAVCVPNGNLKRIINKATSTQISKRYQSASQMKKDIFYCSLF